MSKKRKRKKGEPESVAPGQPDLPGGRDEEFGLVAPTGGLAQVPEGERPPTESEQPRHRPLASVSETESRGLAWKGFEEDEEVDPDPDITFSRTMDSEDNEMDMTPMVDVVFLLLIFFMVTASFTLQKSIEQPPSKIEDPSTNVVEDFEDEDDYVEVIIDQTNTYYVTSRDAEEVEAPSDREMRDRMRDAKLTTGAPRLIIRAHVDSLHKKVVTVWDAGNAAGFEQIEMRTTDEDY